MGSKMLIGLQIKCSLFLSDFNETLIFSEDFHKNNCIKRCQAEAESFQTDRHDAGNIHFHNFMNAPNYQFNFD